MGEAMHQAKKDYHKERHAELKLDPERGEQITRMRKMAIARIEREEKEREERQEQERRAAEKQAVEQQSSGKEASGDLEALKDYERSWRDKVSLYGEDGVRAQVAQERQKVPMPT